MKGHLISEINLKHSLHFKVIFKTVNFNLLQMIYKELLGNKIKFL